MSDLNRVYTFNTGRHYGPEKQPIDWMVIENPDERTSPFYFPYYVLFNDRARGIPGVIPCLVNNIKDLVNYNWVLSMYDNYQYVSDDKAATIIEKAKKEAQCSTTTDLC